MLENLKKESRATVWAEFIDGFQLEIKYRSREDMLQMLAAARTNSWDSKANAVVETFDDNKYRESLAREVIVSWRGLTPDVLEKLVLLEDYPEAEVPYSIGDCIWLLKEANRLDIWVQNLCGQVEAFRAAKRAEATKN